MKNQVQVNPAGLARSKISRPGPRKNAQIKQARRDLMQERFFARANYTRSIQAGRQVGTSWPQAKQVFFVNNCHQEKKSEPHEIKIRVNRKRLQISLQKRICSGGTTYFWPPEKVNFYFPQLSIVLIMEQ